MLEFLCCNILGLYLTLCKQKLKYSMQLKADSIKRALFKTFYSFGYWEKNFCLQFSLDSKFKNFYNKVAVDSNYIANYIINL